MDFHEYFPGEQPAAQPGEKQDEGQGENQDEQAAVEPSGETAHPPAGEIVEPAVDGLPEQTLEPPAEPLPEQPSEQGSATEHPSEQVAVTRLSVHSAGHGHVRRGTVMALCLVCAMIGAIVGGSIVAAMLPQALSRNLISSPGASATYGTSVAFSPSDPTSPAVQVAARLGPSVVGITARISGRTIFGRTVTQDASGSGVILTEDGYVVTNNHVVQNASSVGVTFSDGSTADARIVGQDAGADLAVLKINRTGLIAAELGDSDRLRVGEIVIAIGNPLGKEFTGSVTQGVISGLKRTIQVGNRTLELIQTDAVINPGNSGGPLANTEGKVVGINTLKIDLQSVEGMGFAVPVNIVRPVVADMIRRDGGKTPFAATGRSGI